MEINSNMRDITQYFEGSATSFGVLYPTGYILAFLSNCAATRQVAEQLRNSGIPDGDVIDFTGEEFVELVQAHQENKGLWSSFMETVSRHLGTEAVYVDHDLRLARNGACAVAVHINDDAAKATAKTILLAHNPLAMRYYGATAIEIMEEHRDVASSAQQDG